MCCLSAGLFPARWGRAGNQGAPHRRARLHPGPNGGLEQACQLVRADRRPGANLPQGRLSASCLKTMKACVVQEKRCFLAQNAVFVLAGC